MTIDLSKFDAVELEDGCFLLKPKVVDYYGWVPKGRYWYINHGGELGETVWDNDAFDKRQAAFGNAYPTEAMAKAAIPDIRRAMQIIRACRLVESDYVPDWSNDCEGKYYPFYDHASNRWAYKLCMTEDCASAYVSTSAYAKRVIELLEGVK